MRTIILVGTLMCGILGFAHASKKVDLWFVMETNCVDCSAADIKNMLRGNPARFFFHKDAAMSAADYLNQETSYGEYLIFHNDKFYRVLTAEDVKPKKILVEVK